jgi:hypothetical protein
MKPKFKFIGMFGVRRVFWCMKKFAGFLSRKSWMIELNDSEDLGNSWGTGEANNSGLITLIEFEANQMGGTWRGGKQEKFWESLEGVSWGKLSGSWERDDAKFGYLEEKQGKFLSLIGFLNKIRISSQVEEKLWENWRKFTKNHQDSKKNCWTFMKIPKKTFLDSSVRLGKYFPSSTILLPKLLSTFNENR